MYISFCGREITLGELLRIYRNEPDFSADCPKCGGVVYLISFGFSPLSGRTFPSHRCFGECKGRFSGEDTPVKMRAWGRQLVDMRQKYSMQNPEIKPVHIAKLLEYLGAADRIAEGVESLSEYYEDNCIGGFMMRGSKQIFSFVADGKSDGYTLKKLPEEEPVDDTDVIVPMVYWTEGFAVAVLKAGVSFGYLPGRFKKQAFLDRIIADTDYIPVLGEISPRFYTVPICVKAILGNPKKSKRLLRLIPESMREEVKQITVGGADA